MSEQEIKKTKENFLNALYMVGYWDILDETIQNTLDERENV
ncbi:hypothetical protein [Pueribacillus sp. YX66]